MFRSRHHATIDKGGAYDAGGYQHPCSEETLCPSSHKAELLKYEERILHDECSSASSSITTSLGETDKIRLLKLDIKSTGPLTGSLVTKSLEDLPIFYALSYCWGPWKKSERITIDGHVVHITPSLAEALSRMSRPETVTSSPTGDYIWVDQICINQGDHDERRHQVTLMGQIYQASAKTLIWLGQDDDDIAETAFSVAKDIEALYLAEDRVARGESGFVEPELYDPKLFKKHGVKDWDSPEMMAFAKLLRKPWFRRVWVMQEAVLSKEDPLVLCGSYHCTWSTLARASHWMCFKGAAVMNFLGWELRNIDFLFQVRQHKADGHITEVGWLIMHSKSTFMSGDPRDKIYGLLGMVDHSDLCNRDLHSRIRVNYDQDYSASTLYRDVARHIILLTRSLAILVGPKCWSTYVKDRFRSAGRQGKFAPAPSWTPTFDQPTGSGVPLRTLVQEQEDGQIRVQMDVATWCYAHSWLPAEIEHPPRDPDILRIKGIHVTKVTQVFEQTFYTNQAMQLCGPTAWFSEHRGLKNDIGLFKTMKSDFGTTHAVQLMASAYATGLLSPSVWRLFEAAIKANTTRNPVDIATAVLFVATGGFTWNGKDVLNNDSDVKEFCAFMLKLERDYGRAKKAKDPKVAAALDALAELTEGVEFDPVHFSERLTVLMQTWMEGRRFFVTDAGTVGIGSAALKSGDSVCVLYGGGVPFVLRRKEDFWVMVGEAFVDQLMTGQAVQAVKDGRLEDQWFDIR